MRDCHNKHVIVFDCVKNRVREHLSQTDAHAPHLATRAPPSQFHQGSSALAEHSAPAFPTQVMARVELLSMPNRGVRACCVLEQMSHENSSFTIGQIYRWRSVAREPL